MDLNNVRRVSSAGYRLPERANGSTSTATQPPVDRTPHVQTGDGAVSTEPLNPDRRDPVKQDQVWREVVCSERRGVKEWEKNWGFLRDYDQMGQLKSEEPLPNISNPIPNTTNQMLGSRPSTPLGNDVIRLDRLSLSLWNYRKRKQDPELLPY